MDISQRRFHKLTCSNCRRKKAKCDGAYPACTTCKNLKDAKCVYDKPASIAYVRHLEKQIEKLEDKINIKTTNHSSIIPFTFISQTIKNSSYFTAKLPNHVSNLLKLDADEYKYSISPQEFELLKLKFDITSSKKMSEEILKHSFPLFLPTRIMNDLDPSQLNFQVFNSDISEKTISTGYEGFGPDLPDKTTSSAETNSSSLSPVILAYLQILNQNDIEKEKPGLRQRATDLLTQSLFEPPTTALANACLVHSMMDAFKIDSVARCWMFSCIASKTIVEVTSLRPMSSKRLLWACYIWDKMVATTMNRDPALVTPPPFPPSAMGFNLFDIIPLSSYGTSTGDEVKLNVDIGPVLVASCLLSVVLSDLASKANEFLIVRNKLLETTNQVYDNLPDLLKPDYNISKNFNFPLESCVPYSMYLSLELNLLGQMFDHSFQEQIKTLRASRNISDTNEFEDDYMDSDFKSSKSEDYEVELSAEIKESEEDFIVDEKEFHSMMEILQKCICFVETLSSPILKDQVTVVRLVGNWFAITVLKPIIKILSNEKCVSYLVKRKQSESNRSPTHDSLSYTCLFSDVFVNAAELLLVGKNYHLESPQDHIKGFLQNPPKILSENGRFNKFVTKLRSKNFFGDNDLQLHESNKDKAKRSMGKSKTTETTKKRQPNDSNRDVASSSSFTEPDSQSQSSREIMSTSTGMQFKNSFANTKSKSSSVPTSSGSTPSHSFGKSPQAVQLNQSTQYMDHTYVNDNVSQRARFRSNEQNRGFEQHMSVDLHQVQQQQQQPQMPQHPIQAHSGSLVDGMNNYFSSPNDLKNDYMEMTPNGPLYNYPGFPQTIYNTDYSSLRGMVDQSMPDASSMYANPNAMAMTQNQSVMQPFQNQHVAPIANAPNMPDASMLGSMGMLPPGYNRPNMNEGYGAGQFIPQENAFGNDPNSSSSSISHQQNPAQPPIQNPQYPNYYFPYNVQN